jgi:hypothetical protein
MHFCGKVLSNATIENNASHYQLAKIQANNEKEIVTIGFVEI